MPFKRTQQNIKMNEMCFFFSKQSGVQGFQLYVNSQILAYIVPLIVQIIHYTNRTKLATIQVCIAARNF